MNDETRVAVISGANRGIGLEAARQLAQKGYRVIIGSRDEQKGREAAEGLDGTVEARQLDVSDPESVERFAREVEGEVDYLDALINNAGVIGDTGRRGTDADLDEVKEVLETNVFGAWRLTQALAPLLEKSGHGRVVNISSGMGQLSDMNGGAPSYRVSKTALNALTRIFANELGESGVKVNSACPGWVQTDMGGSGAARTVDEGADTPVWLATLPEDGPTGGFFRSREPIDW
ncbi:MAG: SDR family oxidoreductase [Thermoleophilaceae bacterium]